MHAYMIDEKHWCGTFQWSHLLRRYFVALQGRGNCLCYVDKRLTYGWIGGSLHHITERGTKTRFLLAWMCSYVNDFCPLWSFVIIALWSAVFPSMFWLSSWWIASTHALLSFMIVVLRCLLVPRVLWAHLSMHHNAPLPFTRRSLTTVLNSSSLSHNFFTKYTNFCMSLMPKESLKKHFITLIE